MQMPWGYQVILRMMGLSLCFSAKDQKLSVKVLPISYPAPCIPLLKNRQELGDPKLLLGFNISCREALYISG